MGLCEPHEVQEGQVQSPAPVYRNRNKWIESSPAEDLVISGWNTWYEDSILGCIKITMSSRAREVIVMLYSLWEHHELYCVQLWGPNYKKSRLIGVEELQIWSEGWNTSPVKKGWWLGLPILEKDRERLFTRECSDITGKGKVAVDAPSPEVFKARLDGSGEPGLMGGGWN